MVTRIRLLSKSNKLETRLAILLSKKLKLSRIKVGINRSKSIKWVYINKVIKL